MANRTATAGIDDPRNFTGTDDNLDFISAEHANAGDIFDAKNGYDVVTIAPDLDIDFRSVTFEEFELLSFRGAGALWVNGSQLVTGQLGTAIEGAAGIQTVNIFAPTDYSALALTFTNWDANDGIVIYGSSASQILEGSNLNDRVYAGAGDDLIRGNWGNDNLFGEEGNDSLYGREGDDTLQGDAGNDVLDGGAGADTMSGGTGNDRYYVDTAADVIVEADGEGDDRLVTSVSYVLAAGVSVETLGTSNENSTAAIDITGNELGQTIYGNAGNNILDGGGGNDFLVGGLGVDTLIGGTGNDTFWINDSRAVVVENAGEGDDSVRSAASYTLNSGAMVETMTTTNGSSTAAINLTGNEIAQSIYGNAGANVLNGAGGNDYILGLGGDDIIIGGAGRDAMVGGAGNDTFVFNAATETSVDAPDRILDFATGDLIDLSGIDANSGVAGDQAFTFIGNNTFSSTAGELRYEQINGNTFIYGDTNGDGVADFAINVTGTHFFTSGDFVI